MPSDGWTHTYSPWTWLTSRPPAEIYIVNVHYMMFDKNFRNFGCRVFAQIPKAQRHGLDPQAAGDTYVAHNDASSTYLIYISGTYGTRIERTPAFIEDVDAYAPRLHNSSSVQALPVDPSEMFYKPFHDTVYPEVCFDNITFRAWRSSEDYVLISLL